MTIAELDTLYSAAVAAIDAGSWSTAIAKLMAMKARLATMPNLARNLSGGGSQSITWNATQLDSLIADCRRQQAASYAANSSYGPYQQSKVTYELADDSETY
jgi:hypothetical protein